MRRRSIAGPVVLIGVGFIFLLNNLRPDYSLWHILVRYWPFLLILFGVLRLAEVLVDAGRGAPVVTRPRGGGGLGLILFLCLIFWLAEAAESHRFRFAPWNGNLNNGRLELFGEQFDYPVTTHGDASGISLIVLEGVRGNITINGSDDRDYSVEGRKSIRAFNKRDADEADQHTPVRFARDGAQLILRMDDGRYPSNRRVSTELDLKVPRGVSIEARGRSGDMTVNSISGSVDISADRGDLRLTDIGGNTRMAVTHNGLVRVINARGNVDLEGKGSDIQMENIAGPITVNGSYSGTMEFKQLASPLHFESPNTDMRVEKLPGSLTLDLGDLRANHVAGAMRFHTKSRDVHIEDFADALDVDLTDRGDIDVATGKTPLAKLDLHTRNGNVDLALPASADFDLRANTNQGEAHNEFGPAVKLEINGRAASLKSTEGSGPTVTANTDRGSISIRKNTGTRD